MPDGMGREFAYLSSHATNRYFIPNWGPYDRIHEYMYPYTPWGSLLVMSKLPKFVLGRYRIVLNVRYLFLGII